MKYLTETRKNPQDFWRLKPKCTLTITWTVQVEPKKSKPRINNKTKTLTL